MGISPEVLKKASFLEKIIYNCGKDSRIEEALKEKYGRKQAIQEIEVMQHDVLDYLNKDSYPISAIKTLVSSIMLNKSIEYKRLPATRDIRIQCELKISHVAIARHLKTLVKQRWIKKIECDSSGKLLNNRKQHYVICISKDRAVDYFNFVALYDGEQKGKRRINQLKKIIDRYLRPVYPSKI